MLHQQNPRASYCIPRADMMAVQQPDFFKIFVQKTIIYHEHRHKHLFPVMNKNYRMQPPPKNISAERQNLQIFLHILK